IARATRPRSALRRVSQTASRSALRTASQRKRRPIEPPTGAAAARSRRDDTAANLPAGPVAGTVGSNCQTPIVAGAALGVFVVAIVVVAALIFASLLELPTIPELVVATYVLAFAEVVGLVLVLSVFGE